MKSKPVIGIVGATGLVGSEMLALLGELKVPYSEVRLFASKNSEGEVYEVVGESVAVQELREDSFDGVDLAVFATDSELSKKFVPIAVKKGTVCIDTSSAYRLDASIPLVIPEINFATVTPDQKIIASPNCTTSQLAPVLHAIHQAAGLKRVVVSTYQAASGAGKAALDELWSQLLGIFNQKEVENEVFPHQLAFNVIPQIDSFFDDGYTREEHKVILESRKILGLPDLRITCTAVRVPVMHCHSESVNVEVERPLSEDSLVEVLTNYPGLEVAKSASDYPMPINCVSNNPVYVGRIRKDMSVANGFNLWIVADNLRKGAALNALEIAKSYISTFGK